MGQEQVFADIKVQPHQDFINLAKIFPCPCILMCQKTEWPLPYEGPSKFLQHAPSYALAFEIKAQILLLFCSLIALILVSSLSLCIYTH